MDYYVYILSNTHNTAIYTGVTNDLKRRVYEHKQHLDKKSFTAQYNIEKLVYFEEVNGKKIIRSVRNLSQRVGQLYGKINALQHLNKINKLN